MSSIKSRFFHKNQILNIPKVPFNIDIKKLEIA